MRRKLGQQELSRYARQIVLPQIGIEGQEKLADASVVLIGTGGLGSPAGLYLAAAGVGRLGLVDFDTVDRTNLHRQILHEDASEGTSKTVSAADHISRLNPHVEIVQHDVKLTSSNAMEVLDAYDVVIDGSDNFPTRYLVNDACVFLGKPDVYGSIFRFEGQASLFATEEGPCYRCVYPEPPPPGAIPDCAEAGVLGVLPGVIGTIQATEAIKWIIGIGKSLAGRLLVYDSWRMEMRTIRLERDPECRVCGDDPAQTDLIDYEEFCGAREETEGDADLEEIDVHELKRKMDDEEDSIVVLDIREPHEVEVANIEGSTLIPMGQLRDRLDELDSDKEYLVYCRTGKRSAMATGFLRQHGFNARNVTGGIHAWSDQIDPSQPKY